MIPTGPHDDSLTGTGKRKRRWTRRERKKRRFDTSSSGVAIPAPSTETTEHVNGSVPTWASTTTPDIMTLTGKRKWRWTRRGRKKRRPNTSSGVVTPAPSTETTEHSNGSVTTAASTTTPDIMTTEELHLEQNEIKIEAIQHKNQIFILPDVAEKKASRTPKAKWRDGKHGDLEYPSMNDDERRKLVLSEQELYSNSPNYRGIAKGKTYSDRPFRGKIVHPIPGAENSGINSNNILILDSGNANFDIQVRNMLDGKQVGKDHHVGIRNIRKSKYASTFRDAACRLGNKWDIHKANARDAPGGGMITLGVSKGDGFTEHMIHAPTKYDLTGRKGWYQGVNGAHKSLNKTGRKISRKHFRRSYKSIRKIAKALDLEIPPYLGGKRGLSPQMVQSGHGFYCEPHFDFDISKYCLSIWNSEDGSDPEGWYFIIPAVEGTCGQKQFKGIAIRLRDGTGIEWNGRMLRHCSTRPLGSVNVFGTFFGIMKV